MDFYIFLTLLFEHNPFEGFLVIFLWLSHIDVNHIFRILFLYRHFIIKFWVWVWRQKWFWNNFLYEFKYIFTLVSPKSVDDFQAIFGQILAKESKSDPQKSPKSAKRSKNGHFIFKIWKICLLKSDFSRVKSGQPPILC